MNPDLLITNQLSLTELHQHVLTTSREDNNKNTSCLSTINFGGISLNIFFIMSRITRRRPLSSYATHAGGFMV